MPDVFDLIEEKRRRQRPAAAPPASGPGGAPSAPAPGAPEGDIFDRVSAARQQPAGPTPPAASGGDVFDRLAARRAAVGAPTPPPTPPAPPQAGSGSLAPIPGAPDSAGGPGFFERAAAAAADLTRRALPPLPRAPASTQDVVRGAAEPFAPRAILNDPRAQRVAGDVGAGLLGTAAGMAGAVPLLAERAGVGGRLARPVEAFAKKLGQLSQDLAPDEQNFVDKVVQGATSSAVFLIPGMGIARGAGAAATLGPLALRLAPAVGAGASTLLEAASESGGQFMDQLAAGVPREEAAQRADASFWGNLLLLTVTNKLSGIFDAKQVGHVMGEIRSASMEGLQEAGQSVIEDFTAGRPVDWRKALDAAGIGGIVGLGAGAIHESLPALAGAEASDRVAGEGGGAAEATPAAGTEANTSGAPAPAQGPAGQPGLPPSAAPEAGTSAQTRENPTALSRPEIPVSPEGRTDTPAGEMPVHPTFQGQKPMLEPSVPYTESIRAHPNFVKFFSDADAVVRDYAKRIGADMTPQTAVRLGAEIHTAMNAIRTARTAEARAAAIEAFKKTYGNLDMTRLGNDLPLLMGAGQAIVNQSLKMPAVTDPYITSLLDKYVEGRRSLGGIEAEKAAPPASASRPAAPAAPQFIGYNPGSSDGVIPPIPLFNLPSGDTVSAKTLQARGIPVPEIPSYEDWTKASEELEVKSFLAKSFRPDTGAPIERRAPGNGETAAGGTQAPEPPLSEMFNPVVGVARQEEVAARSMAEAKRAEHLAQQDTEKARLPSRAGMPRTYTEAQALRISLQREARAAAAAYTAGQADAKMSERWLGAERDRIKKSLADKVKEVLPPEARGKFAQAIASARTPKDLAKALVRVDQAVEQVQKRTLIGRIKRNFERVIASKSIAVDYVGRVKGLMQDVLLAKPRAETMARLAETQRAINNARAAGQQVEVPQYVVDKIRALTARPLADMPVARIEDVLDQIKRLADLGKTKLEAMQAIDSAQKESDIGDIMAGSTPIESREQIRALPGQELAISDRIRNGLRWAYNAAQNAHYAITPMDVVFDVMDGSANYAGPNYRIFKARVDNAFGTYADEAMNLREEARARSQKLGLNEKSMERIGVFAIDNQEGGRQKLYNLGLSDEDIGAIKLTPAEAGFYNYMRQNLDRLRPRIAETMRKVYNAELGQVQHYFPFVTDWDQMSEQDLRDRMLTEMTGLRKSAEQGFTKERKGAGKQKVNLNALDVYLKHVDDASYLINVGPTAKYLGELAGSAEYGQAVGNVGQRMAREWIDTIARKGGGFGDQQIRVLDALRRNAGLAALGLRVSSALVQPTTILQGGALIGPRVFQGMTDIAVSRPWRQFIIDNFPELRERAGDDIAFLDFNGQGIKDKAGQLMLMPLQKLDILAARSVAAGAYRKFLADRGIPMDLENPNQQAIEYAQRVVRRTQSSSSFKDAPQALTRGRLTGNRSLDRAILQFQSFVLNDWSLLTHEGIRTGIGKGNIAQGVNTALWSLMAVMAATGIRGVVKDALSGGHDDNRDYWNEVGKNLLSNVPFVSNIMSAFYGREFAPSVDLVARAIKGGAQVAKGDTPAARDRGKIDLAQSLATIAGIPIPSQLADIAKNVVGSGGPARQGSRSAPPRRPGSRAVILR
jgi:hypothetical protein